MAICQALQTNHLSLRPLFVRTDPNWYILAVSTTSAISATCTQVHQRLKTLTKQISFMTMHTHNIQYFYIHKLDNSHIKININLA